MSDYNYLPVSDGTGDAVLVHVSSNRTIGATTLVVDSVAKFPADFIATSGTLLSTGKIDPTTKLDFKGHLSGANIIIDSFEPGSTDGGHTAGQIVVVKPNTGWANRVASFIKNATGFGTPEALYAASLNLNGQDIGPLLMPTGSVLSYAGSAAPSGFLLCQGQAVLRTTYASLFAATGTAYGAGDGSTTFNLPDLQGRMLVGKGTHVDVSTLGNNEGLALASRSPKHRHTVTDPSHTHSFNGPIGVLNNRNYTGTGFNPFDADVGGLAIQSSVTGITVGVAGASLDSAPFLTINYIIKT